MTSYQYYATGVGAREGQGYSIHHATGWYLNFGVAGVVMGAILLGRLWAGLYNNHRHRPYKQCGSMVANILYPRLLYLYGESAQSRSRGSGRL